MERRNRDRESALKKPVASLVETAGLQDQITVTCAEQLGIPVFITLQLPHIPTGNA